MIYVCPHCGVEYDVKENDFGPFSTVLQPNPPEKTYFVSTTDDRQKRVDITLCNDCQKELDVFIWGTADENY